MGPGAQIDTSEIESQHGAARPAQPPCQPVNDLVVQGAPVQWMGMANQGRFARRPALGLFQDGFQPSGRPSDEEGFDSARHARLRVSSSGS